MSATLDDLRARIAALQDKSAEAAAADVAALLSPRFRVGHAEARGDVVALVPDGRGDAFLSDAWSADVIEQIAATTAKIGGSA